MNSWKENEVDYNNQPEERKVIVKPTNLEGTAHSPGPSPLIVLPMNNFAWNRHKEVSSYARVRSEILKKYGWSHYIEYEDDKAPPYTVKRISKLGHFWFVLKNKVISWFKKPIKISPEIAGNRSHSFGSKAYRRV